MYRDKWIDGVWHARDGYLGGLGGAVRRQTATGELVGGRDHFKKADNTLTQLKRILETGKVGGDILSDGDRAIVRALHDDLLRARQGK